MADEENNGAVPPKVKLKINTPGEDNNAAGANSGPATIKIKPIRKVAPKTSVDVGNLSKPKAQTIQLKEPVDTSAVKVDLKPISKKSRTAEISLSSLTKSSQTSKIPLQSVNKKSETSKIALDAAVPKPITIKKSSEAKAPASASKAPVLDAKSKTSRISLDTVMSSVEEPEENVAPTSRPKTVKLKRPVVAPKVTPIVESSDEGITPTRKKTIKTRRPVTTTPTVDLTAEEGAAAPSGPKLKVDRPQAGGAYIADRFANTGPVAPKADNPHWMFAVVGILACVVLAVTIYVQVAQLPNSTLSWVGQVVVDQF